ncbi:MAG: thioredoxin [Alphaproteobacteria bacterium]|jgi:putative thioredoxin|nr:thioredoxin [Alphaproteobacteria bacterium]MDP6589034.1 thioredoxin [Alphaproteobacteria bacterium]MDP6819284.1 thioredoxin [Alphaproteobacteria bacterium]
MEELIGQDAGAPAAVVESSTETFVADVVEGSMERPVIVDFWAPWCEPCKTLGPLLEKVVNAAQGRVKLVKVDIDQNQEIAVQMRIQSIPAVFAFKNGQPVDGFVGAQSESQIKSFVERLTGPIGPTPVEQAMEQAQQALEAEDFNSAANMYSQVLKHAPEEAAAVAGMVRSLLGLGDAAGAREILDAVDEKLATHADIEGARAALELSERSEESGDEGELRSRLAADENDHQARYDLAMVHYAEARNEQAIDELLEIVRRQRDWNEEAAREMLLQIFDALGPTHELTTGGRRKLSSILFS